MSGYSLMGLPLGQMATLFGGLAAAMVLLYLLKLRRRRVAVPYTPLWSLVVEEKQTSALLRRLKRFFSLLVQLTILALLVLALGDPRPGVDGPGGCGFAPPEAPPERHTLLLLDASASMATLERGQTRLEQAARRATEIIDAVASNPAHHLMVATVDTELRPLTLWTASRDEAQAAVARYLAEGARDTPTEMAPALAAARQILSGRAHAEAVLLTDGAFEPADAAPPSDPSDQSEQTITLAVERVGVAGANVGIEAFNVRPYLDDSLTYAIFYALRNEHDAPLKGTLYLYANEEGHGLDDFVADERIVASYALELPAGGVLRDVVGDVKFEGSRLAARFHISPDEPVHDVFARDDVAFAIVPERHKLNVQLVSGGNLFLHASLLVRENVEFTTVEPAAYTGPEGYDVTIIDGVSVDTSRPGHYVILDPQEGGEFIIEGVAEEPVVGKVKRKHPLARNLKLVDLGIGSAATVKTERGDEVVVAAKGGTPLVMTRRDVDGRRAFVLVGFDIRKSLFPLNYAFPLLMVNALNWFQPQPDGLVPTHRAGIELSLPAAGLPAGEALAVSAPDDAGAVDARRVADRLHLKAPRIGVYTVAAADAASAVEPVTVALNLMDRAESDIKPRGDYTGWTAPDPYVPPEPPWPGTPWRALLMGALVIVAIEWLTWHRRLTV